MAPEPGCTLGGGGRTGQAVAASGEAPEPRHPVPLSPGTPPAKGARTSEAGGCDLGRDGAPRSRQVVSMETATRGSRGYVTNGVGLAGVLLAPHSPPAQRSVLPSTWVASALREGAPPRLPSRAEGRACGKAGCERRKAVRVGLHPAWSGRPGSLPGRTCTRGRAGFSLQALPRGAGPTRGASSHLVRESSSALAALLWADRVLSLRPGPLHGFGAAFLLVFRCHRGAYANSAKSKGDRAAVVFSNRAGIRVTRLGSRAPSPGAVVGACRLSLVR